MFKLEFTTSNDAFKEYGVQFETARILRKVADIAENTSATDGPIRDDNFNTVGKWEYTED